MAGDWIKMSVSLDTKPEVIAISAALGLERFAVVGRLHKIWSWADTHSLAGHAVSVTEAFLDELVNRPGFAAAMRKEDWLGGRDGALTFPRFDRHNGQTAKSRALTTDRKRSQRDDSSRIGHAETVTEAGQDRDQRREEKSNTPVVPKGDVVKPKGPIQLRAEAIMKRRPETPLTRSESRALNHNRAALTATTEEDWKHLEAYYAAPQSETYSRKDFATLINNWNGEIDRARKWATERKTSQLSYTVLE